MSESYLPKRNGSSTNHINDEREVIPSRRNGDLAPGGYGYFESMAQPMSNTDQMAKAIDLLIRRKWVILVSFLVVLGFTFAYTQTLVPEYEAISYVMVDLGGVQVDIGRRIPVENLGEDAGFELFATNDRSLSGEIRLLQISDQLVQRVRQRLQQSIGVDTDQLNIPYYSVRFVPDGGVDNIIRFISSSSDATTAAQMAKLYSEEYVSLTKEASRSKVVSLRQSLEEKELEQRDELNFIENQITLAMQGGAIGLNEEASRLVRQIAALEIDREDASIELQVEQAALVSLQNELERINPQVASRISSGLQRQINSLQEQLQREEEEKAQILLANPGLQNRNSDMLNSIDLRITQLNTQIDSLSTQLVREFSDSGGISGTQDGLLYIANLRQQINEKTVSVNRMQAKMNALDTRLVTYKTSVQNLPEQSMELAQLERSRTRIELVYQNTVAQLQEAYIAEESEQGYAQIVRQARVPGESVAPDTMRSIILGIFFGLLLGVSLAILLDRLDNRIYQADQLRQMGLKEIGVVPDMKPLIKREFKGNTFLEQNGQHFSTSLITLLNPVSPVAEAYRQFRTNIQFSVPGRHIQSVLITSPAVSEGKSTTAANLAIAIAQSGRNTLLIDGDMRLPKLHRKFGLPREPGLYELLTASTYFDPDALRTYISNLSILTAGSASINRTEKNKSTALVTQDLVGSNDSVLSNPSELLGSEQMQEFISAMRDRYDAIIIDSPPVLVATDAALLSTQADACVVVARAGITKEPELSIAVEALEDVGASIVGVLLNAFDVNMAFGQRHKYQQYSNYGRFSEYGYS